MIRCLICSKRLVTVNYPHLSTHSMLDSQHPIEDYKRRFNLKYAFSSYVRNLMSAGQSRRYARLGRAWSRARVLSELRASARASRPPLLNAIRSKHAPLCHAARVRFGSLEKAFEAAGIDYDAARIATRWSRDLVVTRILQRKRRRLPLNPDSLERCRDNELLRQARKLFGGWAAALTAAGVVPADVYRRRRWTDQEVLDQIRQRADAGRPLVSTRVAADDPPLYAAAQLRFRGWRDAVRSAGLNYEAPWKPTKWTDARILRTIRGLGTHGRSLKASDIKVRLPGLYAATGKRFGSWADVCAAAGVRHTVIKRPDWTQQSLAVALAEFALPRGGLSIRDLRVEDPSLLSAVYAHLGTIQQARRLLSTHTC